MLPAVTPCSPEPLASPHQTLIRRWRPARSDGNAVALGGLKQQAFVVDFARHHSAIAAVAAAAFAVVVSPCSLCSHCCSACRLRAAAGSRPATALAIADQGLPPEHLEVEGESHWERCRSVVNADAAFAGTQLLNHLEPDRVDSPLSMARA